MKSAQNLNLENMLDVNTIQNHSLSSQKQKEPKKTRKLPTPSQLLQSKQKNEVIEQEQEIDKIVEFINTKTLSDDFRSSLPIDTPLFECIPPKVIFSDYDALDIKR